MSPFIYQEGIVFFYGHVIMKGYSRGTWNIGTPIKCLDWHRRTWLVVPRGSATQTRKVTVKSTQKQKIFKSNIFHYSIITQTTFSFPKFELFKAIHKIFWDKNLELLKMIFLCTLSACSPIRTV